MPTLHNEEIMAIRNTVTFLRKGVALEPSEAKRRQMKRDINELEKLIIKKLGETGEFDVRIEEDAY